MRLAHLAPLLASLALAAGCGGGHHVVGGGVPAPLVTYHIEVAQSTIIAPGQQRGYGIAANTGGSYRMVWTGDAGATGLSSEFWGSVYTPGHFDPVHFYPGCRDNSCALESDDYISGINQVDGGERIDFDTFASTGTDGFDFVVDLEPVIFDLVIDGAQRPELVFFPVDASGTIQSGVSGFPFGLTTT
jgi:hypothetical protein